MKSNKYLIFGILVILILWLSSWLLPLFFDNIKEREQFTDLFGPVNSLFSGLALCGLVYTIYLQHQANKNSQNQFRFNHLLDTTNRQIDNFNARLNEFYFNQRTRNDNPQLRFYDAMEYFKAIENDENEVYHFAEINFDVTNSLVGFIHDSFSFMFELIDNENIDELDKQKIKKLFNRSLNRKLIDFLSIIPTHIEIEKLQIENLNGNLKDISQSILEIKKSMVIEIINKYMPIPTTP